MSWLAYCYEMGYGTSQSYREAYNWYLKAANLYDNYSENKLGEFYYNGYYVKTDLKKHLNGFNVLLIMEVLKLKVGLVICIEKEFMLKKI